MSLAERARLFVAVPLPAPAIEAIAAARPAAAPGVRPVHRSDMHITLHFIGAHDVAPIREALAGVHASRFELEIGGPGHFGLGRRRQAVWLAVERSRSLAALRGGVGDALTSVGFVSERRRYRPHVTLARIGPGADPATVRRFLDAPVAARGLRFLCSTFGLYASDTQAEGPRYRLVRAYSLA